MDYFVVRELLRVARLLKSVEFPSQDAMDQYLKKHPGANKSNHWVKNNKPEQKGEEQKKDEGGEKKEDKVEKIKKKVKEVVEDKPVEYKSHGKLRFHNTLKCK
jgi:hypothetical protein